MAATKNGAAESLPDEQVRALYEQGRVLDGQIWPEIAAWLAKRSDR